VIAILKHGAKARANVRPLRSLGSADRTAGMDVDPFEVFRGELAETRAAMAERDARIAALGSKCEEARREGEASGYARGKKDADDLGAEALALVGKGIDAAVGRMRKELRALEPLAALLAEKSLSMMMGDAGRHGELVGAILRAQLAKLEARAILRVEVSAENFADAEALRALALPSDVELCATEKLKSGECRIRLMLGTLEVGVPQQWTRLSAALTELAPGEAA
jgi:flagellar biosynthesis/type III secretory pathway protein FliH